MYERIDSRAGRCAVWRLPTDATCASAARSLVKRELAALGLDERLMYDAAIAISEVATNAYLHGLCAISSPVCPPELWIYSRTCPRSQLVLKVFDPHRKWNQGVVQTGGPSDGLPDEHGRGLEITASLFGGWSVQLTRSRVCPGAVPGKTVGFCIPFAGSYDQVPCPQMPPAHAAFELHRQLTARGITGVDTVNGTGLSMVFVRSGLTVYCHEKVFRWRGETDIDHRRPHEDLVDVTEAVIGRHEELESFHPPSKTEDRGPAPL